MKNSALHSEVSISSFTEEEQQLIINSVEIGALQYFQERREQVPKFVSNIYSLKGALRTSRKAFGWDLLRAPLNLFWAVPYLLIQLLSLLFKAARIYPVARLLRRVSPGFQTAVQKEIAWLVRTELFELPCQQANRVSEKDSLLETILSQESLSDFMKLHLKKFNDKAQFHDFEIALKRELNTYGSTRVAAADLACSVLNISAGAIFFKKLTPGAITTGSAIAATIAQQTAITDFFLGETLGSVYYSAFPVKPTASLIFGTTTGILALMGLLSAFSGIIADPFQRLFGIHQRRLNKIINSLESNFNTTDSNGFHPKDHYMARIFDVFDFVKTVV